MNEQINAQSQPNVSTEALNHLLLRRTIYGSVALLLHAMFLIFFMSKWSENASNWGWLGGIICSVIMMALNSRSLSDLTSKTYMAVATRP